MSDELMAIYYSLLTNFSSIDSDNISLSVPLYVSNKFFYYMLRIPL